MSHPATTDHHAPTMHQEPWGNDPEATDPALVRVAHGDEHPPMDPATFTEALATLAQAFAYTGVPLIEHAALRQRPSPVWVRPSDRVAMPSGYLGTDVVRLINYQDDRLRVTITNTSTAGQVVTLYERENVGTVQGGFPLVPGAAVTLDTRAPIAAAASATGATWSAIIEYTDLP